MSYGIHKDLSVDNIFKKIDSYNIFKYYCSGFEKFNKKFKSPLRSDDTNPSASIIMYKGDLLFKDFGIDKSYRALDFVMQLFDLTFHETLQKINHDFDLKLGHNSEHRGNSKITLYQIPDDVKEKSPAIIQIKERVWGAVDVDYWYGRYKIKRSTLELFSVRPISHFSINDYLYFADKLSYVYDYYWEDQIFRRKIYQPFSYHKWFSNGGKVVQGEGMLPSCGNLLIVTSSLKDVMTLYELGFIAIAPTSETTFVPEEYFLKQNKRFKNIILFMDSDETGITMNKRLSEKWGLNYLCIEEKYKVKDISDFVHIHGQTKAKEFLYGNKVIAETMSRT